MSRITGTDAYGLMEAYSSVYAPQELTEEQVWEEVENWVNSLLEEGYDLSEYTWEEMFEAYIEEAPTSPLFNTKAFGDFYRAKETERGIDKTFRAGGGQAALRQGRSPLDIMKQGAINLKPSAAPRPAAAAPRPAAAAPRPAAAAPRPAAPAPAAPTGGKGKVAPAPSTPTAAKPATGMLGKTSFERRTPTSAELKAAQAARASGASPEKALQAAKASSAPSPVRNGFGVSAAPIAAKASVANVTAPEVKATNTIAAKTTPTPVTPKPNLQQSIRANRLNMSFDPFDVVMGHLLDEGYADTEEAALKIMANMSEEWRESIINESLLDVVRGVGKVAGNVAKDVKDRVTGKKELIGGPQGYVKVGGPSKPGDVKVSGIGPVGTYGKRTTPTGTNSPAATMSMRAR